MFQPAVPPVELRHAGGKMHPDQINVYKRARLFQPFRLVLESGESYVVKSWEHILATPVMVFVGVGTGRSGLPLELRCIAPESVVRVELLPALDQAS
jgi:hypothetical protein